MVAMKEGDWYCLQCRDLQFKGNKQCRHCGAPRTYSPSEEMPENAMDAATWLHGFQIDEDKKRQFLNLTEDQQQEIILKGPLHGCRDPTAVLVSRLNALPLDPQAIEGPPGKLSGRVKSYSVFKGFGFIYNEEGAPDIFLHVRSIVDGSTPTAGDELTFDLEPVETDVQNQMKAINVRGGSGYPLTEEQKGERKGKGKSSTDTGKGAGKDSYGPAKGGKDSYGPAYGGNGYAGDMWGPYGKGYGGGKAMDWGWGKGSESSDGWGWGKGSEASYAPQGQLSGTVKSYSVFKGFGFIHPNEGEPDIFLHVRSVVDGSVPKAGDTLTFDLEPAETDVPNQMKAINVRGGSGYPLTAEQKGEKGKGKDGKDGKDGKGQKGKDSGKGMGKHDYGACGGDPWGPYGKGCGGWDYGKGWDGGKGWDYGKGWDFGKGGCYGKGGKDWGYGW